MKNLAFASAFFLISATTNTVAAINENFLVGTWARSPADCTRPELTFSAHRLDIAIDADGQAIAFVYPKLTYRTSAASILVKLGKRHPYSKTLDKDALEFRQIAPGVVEMQNRKGKNTKFYRCAKQP